MNDIILSYLKAHGAKIALATMAALLLTMLFSGIHCDTGEAVPNYGFTWFASILWPIVSVSAVARCCV